MNPGYDNPHPTTRRPIAYECMFCHNAYPEIPATAHRDLSASPVYNDTLPEGIDCQRCHGPGAAHVKAAQSPGASVPQIRALILKQRTQDGGLPTMPSRTTSRSLPDRIRHYDQSPFGYMINQPLASFNSYFSRDLEKESTDNFRDRERAVPVKTIAMLFEERRYTDMRDMPQPT